MDQDALHAATAEVHTLLEERLRLRGPDLQAQLRKAGRSLPRAQRRNLRYLADAERLGANPRLLRMIDPGQVDSARTALTDWLRTVDPGERRKTRLIGIAAAIGFNLLLAFILVVTLLWWQGRV